MQKLALKDTWNILEYEKLRGRFRKRIINLKKRRRVAVGDFITLVFENRDTALFQIQEMIRIERMVDEAQIAQEIEVYNTLVPEKGELIATLFVELQGRSDLHSTLQQLVGLDEHVALHIGDGSVIPALFEPGRTRDDRINSVQYLRFPFTVEQQQAFCNGNEPAKVVIDHRNYQAMETLSQEMRAELARDFE